MLTIVAFRWLYEPPRDGSVRLKNDYNRWRFTIRTRVLNFLKRWLSDHSYYLNNKYDIYTLSFIPLDNP